MTTGATLTSNLKAMLTGYEEIDGEEKDSSKISEGRNIAGGEITKSSN